MFPKTLANYIVEFHPYKNKVTCEDKRMNAFHTRKISVWNPNFQCDYFFRHMFVNEKGVPINNTSTQCNPKFIIFTSYLGLEVWSMNLEMLYFLPISEEEKFNDVYSFDVVDGKLVTWSSNLAGKLSYRNKVNIDDSIITVRFDFMT